MEDLVASLKPTSLRRFQFSTHCTESNFNGPSHMPYPICHMPSNFNFTYDQFFSFCTSKQNAPFPFFSFSLYLLLIEPVNESTGKRWRNDWEWPPILEDSNGRLVVVYHPEIPNVTSEDMIFCLGHDTRHHDMMVTIIILILTS